MDRRLLEEAASDYVAEGYAVRLEPAADELPEPLRPFSIGLVVSRGDETIVVEVVPPDQRPSADSLTDLVRAAQRAGWRCALKVLPLHAGAQVMDAGQLREWMTTAEHLLHDGSTGQALMLAWPAVEAVLLRLAERHDVPHARADTGRLLRELVSDDVLSDGEFNLLARLWELRSIVAHGRLATTPVTVDEVRTLLAIARWHADPGNPTVAMAAGSLHDQGARADDAALRARYPSMPELLRGEVVRLLELLQTA